MISKIVVWALVALAIVAAEVSALRARAEPSLQTRIFIAIWLRMMAGEKFLSNHDGPEERKRGEREPDARTGEILRQVGSNPGAKGRPCLHDQSDYDID